MAIRLVLVILLLLGSAEAAFRHSKEIRLKKDAVEQVQILREGVQNLLEFRWTLYTNGNLVLHRVYDGFNAQNVLRLNHTNQSVRIDIDTRGADPRGFSYLVLKFKSFDFAAGEAVFDLLLRDTNERVELNYLNNRTDIQGK
jgi:hypothetical protein